MIRNEAQGLKAKVMMRAYQGIQQVVEQHIWDQIDAGRLPYSQYASRLEEKVPLRPYHLYELESKEEDTAEALGKYFKERMDEYGLKVDQFTVLEQERVKRMVAQTAALMDKVSTVQHSELGAEVV